MLIFFFLSKRDEYGFSLRVFLTESHSPHGDLSAFGLGLPTNDRQWPSTWQVATGGGKTDKNCAPAGCCSSVNG